MPTCTDCGGTVIEYDTAAGNGFCVQCGTVIEENTIVNEVTFGETSSGAAMVQGSFVGQGATHARMSGPYGNRGSGESREQTIANAAKRIQSIASVLRLSEVVCLAATRLYTLAVEHRFTKGRKSLNVVAVCLYVACRQKETRNYMLIDFSDLLQVNVFELGHTYLQLVQTLNLRLPLVDPSHYISRFASLLEFGDETSKVATDAVRLVQRFDRDWMTRGRRPAGICGAALLLAGRMNNFRRSIEEIVQVVKIADSTVRKRLDEFRRSPSGCLTVEDFRKVWLEEEMDPPAYTKGREREEKDREALEENAREDEDDVEADEVELPIAKKSKTKMKAKSKGKDKKKPSKKRKGKRKRGEDTDDDEEEEEEVDIEIDEHDAQHEKQQQLKTTVPSVRQPIDPALLNQGILAGTVPFPPSPPPSPPPPPRAARATAAPSSRGRGREPLFSLQPIEDEDDEDVRIRMNMTMMGIKSNMNVDSNIDPQLLSNPSYPLLSSPPSKGNSSSSHANLSAPTALSSLTGLGINPTSLPTLTPQEAFAEETVSTLVAEEVEQYLTGAQGMMIVEALNEAEETNKRGRENKKRKVTHENEGQHVSGSGVEVVMNDEIDSTMTLLDPAQTAIDPPMPNANAVASSAPPSSTAASTMVVSAAVEDEDADDELRGLNEAELDWFLLSPEEVKIKERVWVELNRDYLEAIAAKNLQAEQGASSTKNRKRRKTTAAKPRDATTPHGSTAAESVRNLLKKNPKYSKRINYEALKDLFVDQPDSELMNRMSGSGGPATASSGAAAARANGVVDGMRNGARGGGSKMDRMSVVRENGMMGGDEDDEERRPIVVIEEEEDDHRHRPSRRSVARSTTAHDVGKKNGILHSDAVVPGVGVGDGDHDAEEEDEEEEFVVGGWEDAYEQEV